MERTAARQNHGAQTDDMSRGPPTCPEAAGPSSAIPGPSAQPGIEALSRRSTTSPVAGPSSTERPPIGPASNNLQPPGRSDRELRSRRVMMDVGDDPEMEQLLEESRIPRDLCVRYSCVPGTYQCCGYGSALRKASRIRIRMDRCGSGSRR